MSYSGIILIVGVISTGSIRIGQNKPGLKDSDLVVILGVNAALSAFIIFNHVVFYCWEGAADAAFLLSDT